MTAARVAVVMLLVLAAFFASAPWLSCVLVIPVFRIDLTSLQLCTLGIGGFHLPAGYGLPGFTGPYWGNLIVGIAYLVAAVAVGKRLRPL